MDGSSAADAAGGKLMQMSDILMKQLERVSDPELTTDDLKAEVERSKAMSGIARDMINTANTVIQAAMYSRGVDTSHGTGWRAVRTLAGPAEAPAVTDKEAKLLEKGIDFDEERPF